MIERKWISKEEAMKTFPLAYGIRFLEGAASIQGSQEWLEFRKGKIGGSDAPSIMNVGFKTPLQLFESKIEDIPSVETEPMRRGKRLEPVALEYLNKKYGLSLEPRVVLHPNPAIDWHFSSVDGIGQDANGEWFVVEIKCPGKKDHDLALSGQIPEKYIPQLNHILEDCSGVDKILYCSYSEDSVAVIGHERNEAALCRQFSAELDFYVRLLNFEPPAPVEKDWIQITDLDLIHKAREYELVEATLKDLQSQKEELRQAFIKSLGDNRRVRIDNTRVQKILGKGRIDYASIPQLKGVHLDQYRKGPVISYRID